MSALSIQPTYPIFTDIDGQPLEDGYVWIGVANLAPIVNPITVYWDAALTIPAAQPIRTRGGYPVNSGTPARLYVNSDYSIQVQNKNGSVVYSAPTATERYSGVVINGLDASEISFLQTGSGAVVTDLQKRGEQFVSVFDFMTPAERNDVSNNIGLADVTAAIQAAIASGARQINWPEGTYRFTQFGVGIFQRHQAVGSVTLITSLAAGNAITVSNQYGAQPPLQVNGFYRQEIFSGPFQIYNDNASSGATGIFFGDAPPATTYSSPNLHINGVVVNRFLVSHAFGNNAYIIQFDNCTFYSRSVGLTNSRGIVVNQVLSNSGGLINYDNCIFQGFQDAIFINLGGLELIFNKCSFDVCTNCLANVANDSVLRFTDCRWEWDGDTTQFNVIGNSVGCSVFIDQPFVLLNGLGAAPASPTFATIGNAGYMIIRSGVWRDAGIAPPVWCSVNGFGTLVYDSNYKTLGVGATVFANKVGAGVANGILKNWIDTNVIDPPSSPFPGAPAMSFRFGNISVASPGIAANTWTDIVVTWTQPIAVVAAFAQVYPSIDNDFYGVISSVPLTSTSHRFTVKNGATAQGVTGQFLIVGYE